MDKDIQWAMDRLNPTNGSVTVIDQSANKGDDEYESKNNSISLHTQHMSRL